MSDHYTRQGDACTVPVDGGAQRRVTTHGGIGIIGAMRGRRDLFVGLVTERTGELGISRLLPDGSLHPIPGAESALGLGVMYVGDTIAVSVALPGRTSARLIPLNGGMPRTILNAGDVPGWFSHNDRYLAFTSYTNGAADLGVFDLATNTARKLTHTPEAETGTEFTPDDKAVVFIRGRTIQRFFQTDVGILAGQR
jgi:hypothetical protein